MIAWWLFFTLPTFGGDTLSCATLPTTASVDTVFAYRQSQSPTYLAHEAAIRRGDSLDVYWPLVRAEAEPVRVTAKRNTSAAGARDSISVTDPATNQIWYVIPSNRVGRACRRSNEVWR